MEEREVSQDLTPTVLLPEDAIFVSAVTAVSYIDGEGRSMYRVSRSGNGTFLQSLGLLEGAKYALIEETLGKQ